MKAVLAFMFYWYCTCNFAQTQNTDSLRRILNNGQIIDTVRINTLLLLSEDLAYKDLDNSLSLAMEAIERSEALNWNEGLARSYRQAGIIEYYKPNYDKALNHLHLALTYSERSKNALLKASIYNNIANIYADLKEFDKALVYYDRLLKVAREANSEKDELIALFNIATIYTELGDYDRSLQNFFSSLDLAEKASITQHLPAIYNNIARTYQYMHEDEQALQYLDQGIAVAEESDNRYILSTLLRNKGELLRDANQFEQAELSLIRSIELSQENGSVEWESLAWETLSSVYEQQNKAELALDAFRKHIRLRDSIINEEKKAELIKKDLIFEKEKDQALYKAEIERQKTIRNASILGGGSLLFMAGMAMFFYRRRLHAISEKEKAEFKAKVADTELKALRAQMNPHFIFNTLNSINSFFIKNNREAASDYLKKFAGLIRKILENSEKKLIPLKEDLELLNTYFEIESRRLPDKFDHIFIIDESIDTENTLVPPLILQPFIENSIWHGIANKKDKGVIAIEVRKRKDTLLYVVDDNGVGRKPEKRKEMNRSMGMQIATNRIAIINATESNGGVKVIDKEEGLRVEIELPLTLAF
ncbi:tetratricopeptide repeat-containing sensor histidine kinase [Robertkochia solimangrovi]|uniref:tetratricopeptide repeat-containing sensor histidine kinase n=1 Tax=Robertkochia solimangrovi TaxID=2213046 RepID=UPI00117D7989|nr:tetratricopeptide repeat protein [Robertkochia solimangrovi]TRZ46242.1 hypothetical protein DMZ48_03010 [Robertkochia solimangrovi]